jgi:predicted RNA-binding protein with RPS1 domain
MEMLEPATDLRLRCLRIRSITAYEPTILQGNEVRKEFVDAIRQTIRVGGGITPQSFSQNRQFPKIHLSFRWAESQPSSWHQKRSKERTSCECDANDHDIRGLHSLAIKAESPRLSRQLCNNTPDPILPAFCLLQIA